MNNPVYGAVAQNREQNISQQFINFQNNFGQMFGGMDPAQIGPQLVNSGRISQSQFEQFRQIANAVTGMNK